MRHWVVIASFGGQACDVPSGFPSPHLPSGCRIPFRQTSRIVFCGGAAHAHKCFFLTLPRIMRRTSGRASPILGNRGGVPVPVSAGLSPHFLNSSSAGESVEYEFETKRAQKEKGLAQLGLFPNSQTNISCQLAAGLIAAEERVRPTIVLACSEPRDCDVSQMHASSLHPQPGAPLRSRRCRSCSSASSHRHPLFGDSIIVCRSEGELRARSSSAPSALARR